MVKIKLKRLILFLLETLILQETNIINEWFVYSFNQFIERCYRENEQLLSIIYDVDLVKEFIDGNYEMLSFEQMYQMIQENYDIHKYIKLVEEVGCEIDAKLNELAVMFIDYQQELMYLYYADASIYYSKGYTRILS